MDNMYSVPTLIGVAGGTGSGKTTLAKKLFSSFDSSDVILISHDSYYKPHDNLSFEQRSTLNYDHPDAFDTDIMVEHLKELKKGKPIECPRYSFEQHTRLKETVLINPAKIIIVEGILIFDSPQLRTLFDMKIFVDTDADVRFIRRLVRDVNERGRTLDSVIEQYLQTVKPMHDQFVEPSKRAADIIIPEGGLNPVAINILIDRISAIIKGNS